ncbi:MurR/RpiR family transcriptional regulator [[Acholeplasma] multilocale]|uniref:MurR/RpiR family transcriptional regulator n=1 Tax=[Acholeplasma] multilocale TaxID=264638 RepID=UPI000478C2E0|nr:MurR/RpiR family transcriptional regulator [[Acholeplasma] multilocale]
MRSFLAKLSTIEEKDLTTRELQIVDYIRENLQNIVQSNMKIEQLAQEVGTGYSAIYGLLNKLNIKGYRDFSISLANDADSAEIKIAKNDENVANGYINIIKQNYSLIEKRTLFSTLTLIKSAPRIFVAYWENVLRGPAQDLENFFYEQHLQATSLDSDWDTINRRVENVQSGDLFILFTKYGTSKHLEKIIQKINLQGGKVIFVSGRMPSIAISKTADSIHTLIVDGVEIDDDNVMISKSVPFHYFNDLLIYHYLNTNEDK